MNSRQGIFLRILPRDTQAPLSQELDWLHRVARRKVRMLIMWGIIAAAELHWGVIIHGHKWRMESSELIAQIICPEYLEHPVTERTGHLLHGSQVNTSYPTCRVSSVHHFLWWNRLWLKSSCQKWMFLQVFVGFTNYKQPQVFPAFFGLLFKNYIYLTVNENFVVIIVFILPQSIYLSVVLIIPVIGPLSYH